MPKDNVQTKVCPHCKRQAVINKWAIVNVQKVGFPAEELCADCANDLRALCQNGQSVEIVE